MSAGLLDVPYEVLLFIVKPLDAKDKVSLLATCRRLRELETVAPAALWRTLSGLAPVDPSQALRLARWLQRRAAHVRRVQLSLRFEDRAGTHAPHLLGKLAGAPLASLDCQARGSLELAGWLAALPALERVCVGAHGGALALQAQLAGALPALRVLRVWATAGVKVDPECLPASLEELDVQQPPTGILRSLGPAGGSLRRLTLSRSRAALDCAQMGALTAVTALTLAGCHLAYVPAQLSQLTQLRELNMQTNKLEGEGWAHLLPLRSLSRLDLRHQLGNRRLALPAGLLSLPSLQELFLADNPFTQALPVPPASSARPGQPTPSLATLSLDFEVATRSHAAISRLAPSLKQLWLVSASGQVGVAAPALCDASALLCALARLPPGLKVRWWDLLSGRTEFDLSTPLALAGLTLRAAQRYPALLAMRLD